MNTPLTEEEKIEFDKLKQIKSEAIKSTTSTLDKISKLQVQRIAA